MLVYATKTVRELAVAIPNATRLFEKLKIDYCCGGDQSLGEACGRAGVSVETVGRWLEAAQTELPESEATVDFQSWPLADLTNYIVKKHHVFIREECVRLNALLEKVCSAKGGNHSELLMIQSAFQRLQAELEPHMFKEERVLFPYIEQLATAVVENRSAPQPPFGTVRNPVTVMMREHDVAGEIMREIRILSGDFIAPTDACLSYRTLYTALEEFEADLHEHIHLENNILFPRAVELEGKPVELEGKPLAARGFENSVRTPGYENTACERPRSVERIAQ